MPLEFLSAGAKLGRSTSRRAAGIACATGSLTHAHTEGGICARAQGAPCAVRPSLSPQSHDIRPLDIAASASGGGAAGLLAVLLVDLHQSSLALLLLVASPRAHPGLLVVGSLPPAPALQRRRVGVLLDELRLGGALLAPHGEPGFEAHGPARVVLAGGADGVPPHLLPELPDKALLGFPLPPGPIRRHASAAAAAAAARSPLPRRALGVAARIAAQDDLAEVRDAL
mmetsp:Transcript_65228/g.180245  ORF Transcript_65228/g.180245 Transcript_65228/m.180245 type:complete len:227 (-) Transcript_65228:252-932(-)